VVDVLQQKVAIRYLLDHYRVIERRADGLAKLLRKTFQYQSMRPPQEALRRRIVEFSRARIRYGYKRIHVQLKREGIHVNHKRVHRLYCFEGLHLRTKRPRHNVSLAMRQPPTQRIPDAPNLSRRIGFFSDQFVMGLRFRALTIIYAFTRECLAVVPGNRLGGGGDDVVRVISKIVAQRGAPRRIYCDNRSEFSGGLLELWTYTIKVILEVSHPGRSADNVFIESFNGSFRDEWVNVHWFDGMTDAHDKKRAWKAGYNESRARKVLNNLTPLE
tara:strand:+ start:1000 stop:1818 length:819 start_codon:yes stop_codon:yes gene_type:complete